MLAWRKRFADRFDAPYRPLDAAGPHAHRVFAFARGDALIAVVPRLGVHADGWRDTTLVLPRGPWRDVLSDRTFSEGATALGCCMALAELWRPFPIALLAWHSP